LVGLVEFEFAFGVWLLVGYCPRGTWRVAVACFGAFAGMNLYQGLTGTASCGCFGRVSISPWWTLLGDLTAVAALLCWRPLRQPDAAAQEAIASRWSLDAWQAVAASAVIFVLVGVPTVWAMATFAPVELSAAGELLGDGKLVVLEPQRWIGKPLPLLDWIESDETLGHGRWTVVLHKLGCSKCERLIREYEEGNMGFGTEKVAFVALESCGERPVRQVFGANVSGCMRGKYSWAVETPLELCVDNGEVISVGYGASSQ
jgi:hypothetical protein